MARITSLPCQASLEGGEQLCAFGREQDCSDERGTVSELAHDDRGGRHRIEGVPTQADPGGLEQKLTGLSQVLAERPAGQHLEL